MLPRKFFGTHKVRVFPDPLDFSGKECQAYCVRYLTSGIVCQLCQ